MREMKLTKLKVEDLTGETERRLIRQEVVGEIRAEVSKLKPLSDEEFRKWCLQEECDIRDSCRQSFKVFCEAQAQLASDKKELLEKLEGK